MAPDGKALFYLAPSESFIEVELSASPEGLDVRSTHRLFDAAAGAGKNLAAGVLRFAYVKANTFKLGRPMYDVSADGQRFLFNAIIPDTSSRGIAVALNWKDALR